MCGGNNVSNRVVSFSSNYVATCCYYYRFSPFGFCSDESLEKTVMALRKFDLLDLDVLASGDPAVLKKIQSVMLVTGFNLFRMVPAEIMGFAYRVKHHWNGRVPTDPKKLGHVHGIGRKVLMLILQDAFHLPQDLDDLKLHKLKPGIVGDRHVFRVAKEFGWSNKKHVDMMCRDMESWMEPALYKQLNESIGALRQLYRDTKHKTAMEEIAAKLGYSGILDKVVAGVTPQNQKYNI